MLFEISVILRTHAFTLFMHLIIWVSKLRQHFRVLLVCNILAFKKSKIFNINLLVDGTLNPLAPLAPAFDHLNKVSIDLSKN